MSLSEIQWLTVDRRSNVLVPRETSRKVVEQYQHITNKQVTLCTVELYIRSTADFNIMEDRVSESMSKSAMV
jgi:hypothetical protein